MNFELRLFLFLKRYKWENESEIVSKFLVVSHSGGTRNMAFFNHEAEQTWVLDATRPH